MHNPAVWCCFCPDSNWCNRYSCMEASPLSLGSEEVGCQLLAFVLELCLLWGKRASELLFITSGSVPARQSPMAAVHLTIIHHYPKDVKQGAGYTLTTTLQLNLLVSYQVLTHIIVQMDQIWCQKSEKSPGFHVSEYKVAERLECTCQWTRKCLQSLQARLICPGCLGLCCPSPHTVQDRQSGIAYY